MPNDDPKWDELEQEITRATQEHQARLLQIRETHNELKLQFAPQVEADEWPEFVE